jgi:DNA-binding CsgD family transcriptional regulator
MMTKKHDPLEIQLAGEDSLFQPVDNQCGADLSVAADQVTDPKSAGSAQTQVHETLPLIFNAAADSREWTAVLQHLRQKLNAAAVALVQCDLATKDGDIVHHVGYEPAYVRQYKERYAACNVWLCAGEWQSQDQVTMGDELISAEQLVTTDFYCHWLKPQGFFHRVCGVISCEGERIIYFEVMRSSSQERYDDQQRQWISMLLPHFRRALASNDRAWQLVVAQDILNHLPFAVLATDSRCRVLFANQAAYKKLRYAKKGLMLQSQQLCASAPAINHNLKELIRNAASGRGDGFDSGGVLTVRRGGQLTPLWLVTFPISRPLRKVVGQESEVALVFVSTPERLGELLETTLKKYYHLTPREQELTALMIQGLQLKDAASMLNISLNTARTHMKRVYAKTNTERLIDLVHMLLTGPAARFSMSDVGSESTRTYQDAEPL